MKFKQVSNPERKHFWILGILTFTAFIIRNWGITYGLPHIPNASPDVLVWRLDPIMKYLFNGDMDPHYYTYPSLLYYVNFLALNVYYGVGWLLGKFNSIADFQAFYHVNPSNFIIVGRLLVNTVGSISVIALYFWTRRFLGGRAALLCCLLLVFAPIHVFWSHFMRDDAVQAFIYILTFYFLTDLIDKKHSGYRSYIMVGICGGLAVSIKLQLGLLIIPFITAYLLRQYETPAELRDFSKVFNEWQKVLVCLGIAFLSFFATSPYIIIRFEKFLALRGFVNETEEIFISQLRNLSHGWKGVIFFHLRYSLGWAWEIAAALGILLCLRRPEKIHILILSHLIPYLAVMANIGIVTPRYMVVLVPALTIFAVIFMEETRVFLEKKSAVIAKKSFLVPVILCGLIMIEPLINIYHTNRLTAKQDSRISAIKWAHTNIPHKASIGLFGGNYNRFSLGKGAFPNFTFHLDPRIEFTQDYVILCGDNPLVCMQNFSRIPDRMLQYIVQDYTLVKAFIPLDRSKPDYRIPVFDQTEALWVPLAKAESYTFPGPEIRIYKKKAPAERPK